MNLHKEPEIAAKSAPFLLQRRFFAGLLVAIGLQYFNCLLFSQFRLLEWSVLGTLAILVSFLIFASRSIFHANRDEILELTMPWRSIWPWLFLLAFFIQITVYPPMMHDSLSYRLPRIFLALQEGAITRFPTADERMNYMPWGWESNAIPFAALNCLPWCRLIGVTSWMIVFHLTHRMISPRVAKPAHATLVALALVSAPFFTLQAVSTANDLYASALLLVAAWMVFKFRDRPCTSTILFPLLAIVLAANAKPQFLLAGCVWLLWFFADRTKPWKAVDWRWVFAAAPLFTLVSPIPWLLEGYFMDGSLTGDNSSSAEGAGTLTMMIAGTVQFLAIQFQLPVFPGAPAFNSILRELPGFSALGEAVPKFSPGVSMISQIDNASFGLFSFSLICAGLAGGYFVSGKFKLYALLSAAVIFLIASSIVVPATIGRSFAGFVIIVFPIACAGLAGFAKHAWFRSVCLIVIVSGVICMILNPSAPLWPVERVKNLVEDKKMPSVVSALEKYQEYRLRADTGRGILDEVPNGEEVGVMLRTVTPVVALWQPDWRKNRIFYINNIPPEQFATGTTNWMLVAGKSVEYHPTAYRDYTSLPGWEIVKTEEYLSTIAQGADTWNLYKRVGSTEK